MAEFGTIDQPHSPSSPSSLSSEQTTPDTGGNMPPERSRTANPQGRQKSCSECAKSKRKCDLQTPNCLRCRRQHLTCVYPPQPQAFSMSTIGTQEPSSSHENPHEESTAIDSYMHISDTDDTTLPFDLDVATMAPVPDVDLADFDFSSGVRSIDALHGILGNPTPNPEAMVVSKALRADRGVVASDVTPFMRSRLEYSIEQLTAVPKMMVEENATIWSHRKLYEDHMPNCLQTAQATCALFISRNEKNSAVVARHITERTNELTKQPVPLGSRESLARAHALMLYQIMVEFGTDLRFFGLNTSLLPHIEDLCQTIVNLASQQTDPVGPLQIYPSAPAQSAWTSYVFRESLRRTVLAMVQLIAVCRFLHGQMSTCDHTLSIGNRVTVSAHLWKAQSAFEFAKAWNEKRHFLVRDVDFTEVLKEAEPDDLDTFSKMVLGGIMGADDVRGWFYTRGGVF